MALWPTLPDPAPDPNSWQELLRSVKQMLEMVTGQRGGAPVAIMRMYRADVAPGAANSTISLRNLQDGDIWIDTSNSNKIHFWNVATMAWVTTS